MLSAHQQYPQYSWGSNKGYPTLQHKMAIRQYGFTPLHRITFKSDI